MSTALSEVFARAAQLPEAEQEALARMVVSELEELSRLASSDSPLARLGREAWAEHDAGRTRPLARRMAF